MRKQLAAVLAALAILAVSVPSVGAATTWTARMGSYGVATIRVGSPDKLSISAKNFRARIAYTITLRRGSCAAAGTLVYSIRLTSSSTGTIVRTLYLTSAQTRAAKLPLSIRIGTKCGAFAAPAPTPTPTPTPTGGDSVSGSGYRLHKNGEPHLEFWVDARATTGGAIGSYSFRHPGDPELRFSGPISCLDVVGNQATIGGTITQSSDPVYLGHPFLVFFIDLGSPYSGQDGPDIASQTYIYPVDVGIVDFGGDFPATCPDAATTAHDAFDVRGNVVVKDGP